MKPYRVAIIGTGRPRGQEGATGAAMSYRHARGYLASERAEIVALADIRPENAAAFREEHGIPQAQIFTDYKEMLREVKPDVVSVCTWPHLHAEMVIASAEAGVRAVHCEKPMAPTFGEAKRMYLACLERGVQLTFNHQRRFEPKFRTVRRLIREGAVGQVVQLQASCPNLYDWGTHWFDMIFFYNGDVPAEWVMGQIDSRNERAVFGVRMEDQGLSYFAFQNGVRGLLITGDVEQGAAGGWGNALGAVQRIIGTEGVIEVPRAGGTQVRLQNSESAGFRDVPPDGEPVEADGAIAAGIADLLRCLESGEEPELAARKAIQATELIFATYESSRRRARVDLPLKIEDSPLLAMLEQGAIGSAQSVETRQF